MAKEKDQFAKIAEILTGEKNLREKEEKLQKEKKKAIEEEKDRRRAKIVKGEEVLEVEEVQKKEIVQNIKLFEWKAPERYEVQLNKKSFLIILLITLIFIVLLAILGKYYLIAAIISVLFVLYAASSTKPLMVTHKITARGIDTAGKLYEWYMLEDFYFAKKGNMYTLMVQIKLNFPKALVLLCSEKDKDPLFVILQKNLLYKDIRKKQNRIDVISYGEYIPLEKV